MSEIYLYKYMFQNNQKILSAWMLFTVKGSVKSIQFIDSTLYAVTVYNGQVIVEKCRLEEGHEDVEGYNTNLDRRIKVSLSAGDDKIMTPYTAPATDELKVYTTDGLLLPSTREGKMITLNTPVTTDTVVYIGLDYTMKYTFSEQLFKAKSENTRTPSNAAKLMIRNGSIYYDKTAYFKVKVTPAFRDTYENTFTPDVVGSSTIGSLTLGSGFYRFPVFTKAQDTKITIENDSALPSNFQTAEFESFVHSRSNRYG